VLDPAPRYSAAPGAALAAVLAPVLATQPEPRLVFTKRADSMSRHAGEISFPGGLLDPGEDLPEAALREAEEELGISPDDVELVGALPPVHTHVSGILIVPFVGMLWSDPRFTPNEAEIAEVIEVPVATLIDVGGEREFTFEGSSFRTFVFPVDEHVIWGATGRILKSLLDLLAGSTGPEAPLETREA
jgi:8-oxo-dGTP pyrophosphatase MutT (NUDIX family)